MKKIIENVLDTLLIIGIVGVCCLGLILLDNSERKNAIDRCNGENNIIEKTTTTGEKYYQCRIEK
jgi:hypothetical protein